MKPHFRKFICDSETPVSLYTKLALEHDYAFLLESAETHQTTGRYSFIGFDTLYLHEFPAGGTKNPLEVLRKTYEGISYTADPELPKLQAGFVGYFSYELVRHFENLKLPVKGAEIPEGIFFLPKNLLIFDHFDHTLTLVAYNKEDFEALLKEFKDANNKKSATPFSLNSKSMRDPGKFITSNTQKQFEKTVKDAKKQICAGETFQIVVSQLFQQKVTESDSGPVTIQNKHARNAQSFNIYRGLRLLSPSPYMYHLQYPDFSIIGSSPETLVQANKEEVIIRPIAGTRRRGKTEKEDAELAEELVQDKKEQAEHMMLVDLGRNDVGRVAEPGSVHVTRVMEVEKYSHVMHLVSEVRGKRNEQSSLFDIFRDAFPAGTLTGAPKIRAMEIIAKLEKHPRDIYGGAVGYFDLSGNMDFAIAIRTMLYKNGTVSLRAGAGIVYDSVPTLEYKECCNKARGPLTALN